MQTAGPVVELEADDACLVMPSGGRDAVVGAGHDDKAGGVVVVVLDVGGQQLEAVEGSGQLGPDGRGCLGRSSPTTLTPSEVDRAATSSTPGRLALSHRRHWAVA